MRVCGGGVVGSGTEWWGEDGGRLWVTGGWWFCVCR